MERNVGWIDFKAVLFNELKLFPNGSLKGKSDNYREGKLVKERLIETSFDLEKQETSSDAQC